ncbi:Uncharacterized conserved protein YkwD, contains CAP (CSP/antigen 5/PR1) domain [Streptomyces zhaozhouensis]|uniref:Uncharacterized conserved protein YkwD, contains CAP (CSP/antigen 5/PR1) domain n=1 Tax=Streptomyces zhaozhouensis TaxID=1300267 RepID=A0A286E111_9ACTN|nr:CAP domain-containing protein [Streptomyces zhaozhouensis]SOD64583.1 Uncharacterized conserved protein YkwD, contains CAP (CSP/antigen 5/PR1) domain [Streptomyces zhaozhouensis]
MGRHRRRRGYARTGLIGASAALTVGAVAVGSGLMPGLTQHFTGEDTRTDASGDGADAPLASETLEREEPRPSRSAERESEEPTAEETESAEETPSEEPEPEETTEEPEPTPEETERPRSVPEPEPEASAPPPTEDEPSDEPTSPEVREAEAVLRLVNEARGQSGCQPLRLDAGLTNVALAHSRDMAERGYFDHTDPDGRTPWDRAAEAGISNMGGENIAMGQQNARSVMDSWMNSEGHRANILNCDFTTMGLGAHFADGGGPWWTQTFGF